MSTIELSVVIGTYNRRKDLEECLNSLFSLNEPPSEVIVVDSNSTDGTHELVKRYPLKFVSIKERSMVVARNIGLQHATGDVVAYVDDDAVVHKDWSIYILAPYQDKRVGGVGGRVLPYGTKETRNASLNRLDIGKVFDDGLVLGNFDLPVPHPIEVDTFIGCNMSFRRELLQKIGRFDENFKSNCFREEVDVCTRMKKYGYKLIYNPEALVWHKWRKYVGDAKPDYKWFYWTAHNNAYFYFKNFQPITVRKLSRFLYRSLFPNLKYTKRIGVELKPSPLIAFYVLLGILFGALNTRKSTGNYTVHSRRSWKEPIFSYRTRTEGIASEYYSSVLKWALKFGTKQANSGLALDVGCGRGFVCKLLSTIGYKTTGVDISIDFVKEAKLRCSNALIADATRLSFKSSSFNMITCFEVIEHLSEPERAIKEINKGLKDQGLFVLTIPLKNPVNIIVDGLRGEKTHISLMPLNTLRKIIERHFKEIHYKTIFILPIPPVFFKRYFYFNTTLFATHVWVCSVKNVN
jgi:glycosyltransferase involved in cell wall biosynthesis/2-polyprenyl-3-methyl-5-hydroxy-6-metoxy-1,4-benzoquinol methylase